MSKHHLVIENGAEKGKYLQIPAMGARVGRSSRNDITLPDPMLSRHHCRFHFKPGDGLWISDLGSVNQTLVDNEPVTEAPLRTGQLIEIGETLLRVVDDERGTAPSPSPVVDLGFGHEDAASPSSPRTPLGMQKLIFIGALALLAIGGAYGVKWWYGRPTSPKPIPRQPEPKDWTLEINYEKIDATPANIFRYHLTLSAPSTVTIELDDLANNKRLTRSVEVSDPAILRELAESVESSGFFTLEGEYRGILPDTIERKTLAITVGKQTHTVVVENRLEPPIFETIRTRIEDFGTTELKLWAVPYSADKLTAMAEDKLDLARKLFTERGLKTGNLAGSVAAYREAIWFLETVADKPTFYPDLAVGLKEAEEELERRYIEQNFRAVQAMQTGDWQTAERELRIILDMIPDRSDQRHKDAERQLMEAEQRNRLMK
jgi:hypothetical protein